MSYALPSLSEIRAFGIAVGRAVLPQLAWSNPRSLPARLTTFVAALAAQLSASFLARMRNAMPDSADDSVDGIERWGRLYDVERQAATVALGTAAARVFGNPGAAIPALEKLVSEVTGLRYEVATGSTIPAAGYVDVDLRSISTGSAARLVVGDEIRFVATPPGLQGSVRIVADLGGGDEREPFGAYRARVLERIATPGTGGNAADYKRWMLEVPGVVGAYVYGNRAGFGSVDIVGLRTGYGIARELDASGVAALLSYVRERAPLAVGGTDATPGPLRHLDVVASPTKVVIEIEPDPAAIYANDWTGSVTVATWAPSTRTLTFTSSVPATMKAGHRIVLVNASDAQDGREYRIEAIASSTAVILESAPAVDPVAGDVVISGGPLVTPIRDAILAHLNGITVYAGPGRVPLPATSIGPGLAATSAVGLEVIAEGLGPANPKGRWGSWVGDLVPEILERIAGQKGGVRRAVVTSPSDLVEAEDDGFPLDAQIHMIVPSVVRIEVVA